ncbi:unnamed protein product [Parnassius apollo]|uniref:(apollo) hypothetical protein n=1 Tax=Parnassius apollo TaxID=110799 RepID=A0A8S3Y8P8_PARAO|nr:unnamed protein product [Parnassius apollo]
MLFQFNTACDEWRRSQSGSILTIGTLFVLPITGYISDRWGRRVALTYKTVTAFNTGWIGFVRSFVNSYEWFLALEFFESALGSGAYSCSFILVWWVTNNLVYYGMSINAVKLSGNQYLNYIVVTAIEIPGYWTVILLLDRVGRKPVLIFGYWLCAACQFVFTFIPEGA